MKISNSKWLLPWKTHSDNKNYNWYIRSSFAKDYEVALYSYQETWRWCLTGSTISNVHVLIFSSEILTIAQNERDICDIELIRLGYRLLTEQQMNLL